MVRKQVYIEERQELRLKQRAELLGVTEAELIRRSLDRGLDDLSARRPDPAAWARIERYIRSRRVKRGQPATRRWTRDELHAR